MSSLLNSSINGSSSNLSDGSGRTYTSSFAGQSGAPSPVYHHAGSIQGLHNIHGNYNVPNLSGNLGSRNSGLNGVPSSPGVQQQNGSISNGRFASSNLPVPLSQMSHGSSHGHPDSHLQMSHGSSHGHPDSHLQMSHASSHGHPDSHLQMSHASSHGHSDSHFQMSHGHTGLTNRTGLGVSPMLGNAGSRMTSSMGNNNMVGGGTMGRTLSSGGGGLSNPSLGSRLNLAVNAGTGNIGQNRMMSGVLPQGSPQVLSMLGNSYPTAGGLSQNHVQTMNSLNSMGMLNDMNSNDTSPFDINSDFPQLTSRPGSDGGQGQLGSRLKQGLGISPIVQQNQEFSIQNEDFPALPGYKGSNADYPMDLHHKEQHENSLLMMQSQQLPMGRSGGFSLGGGYTSHHPQQQQQQQHAQAVSGSGVSIHGADIFSSSHPSYHSQAGGPTSIGLRSMNSANSVSNYDQLIQQYQQQQNSSQYRLQQMSSAVGAVGQPFRDVGTKPMQAATQSNPDRFGLLGLRSIIKMTDPALSALALGIDLTTLGLNLNSTENLYKTFGSPWSNEPAKADPEFSVPQCYYARSPPPLHPGLFAKLLIETLFYIFYSMPKDEAQLYAANELNNRAWFYHKEHRLWFIRVGEPLVKTSAYERGSYHCFDPNTFETVQKDNFVLFYEMLEKRPSLSHQHLM